MIGWSKLNALLVGEHAPLDSLAQSSTVSEVSRIVPGGSVDTDVVERRRRETITWQRGLLPFMTYFVVVMAAAFFLFSGFHVYEVSRYIKAEDGPDIRSVIQAQLVQNSTEPATAAQRNDRAILLLEAETLHNRYKQAGGMLMARIWSRQLAFITGMVLAFVGAVFILGKLNDDNASQVSGEGAQMKVAISTASPGLILSLFGTVMIIASLFVPANLDVSDGAAYLGRVPLSSPSTDVGVSGTPGDKVAPPTIDNFKDWQRKSRVSPER